MMASPSLFFSFREHSALGKEDKQPPAKWVRSNKTQKFRMVQGGIETGQSTPHATTRHIRIG